MKTKYIQILIFVYMFIPHLTYAIVINVGAEGDYQTIQAAIDDATDSDEIIVEPGIYTEDIDFKGKNIALKAINSQNPSDTVIGNITISGGETGHPSLTGFKTGRIVIENTSPIITNCLISENALSEEVSQWNNSYVTLMGAGIYIDASNPVIQDCTISDNYVYAYTYSGYHCEYPNSNSEGFGGGIYCRNSTLTLKRCMLENNSVTTYSESQSESTCWSVARAYAISYGGGIYAENSNLEIINCIIVGNKSEATASTLYYVYSSHQGSQIARGGGIYGTSSSTIILTNCTIVGNSAVDGGGGLYNCSGNIKNCIIWGNENSQLTNCSLPSFCCIQNWTIDSNSNLFTDPNFADTENQDFHILKDSPCIDSGGYIENATQDIESNPRGYNATSDSRGDGSDFDIGAYEYIGDATQNNTPAKPVNLQPADGVIDVSTYPTLNCSEFSDTDKNTNHSASRWQIDETTDFSSPRYDSGVDKTNLISISIPEDQYLSLSTKYYWRVKHADNFSAWSE